MYSYYFLQWVTESKDKELKIEYSSLLQEMGLKYEKIVKVKFSKKFIYDKQKELEQELLNINVELDRTTIESLPGIVCQIKEEINSLRVELNEPGKIYEQSLVQMDDWKSKRDSIIGKRNTPDTINYILNTLNELADIPKKMEAAKGLRITKTKEIFQSLKRLCTEYIALYAGVQQFIESKEIAKKININFSVTLSQKDFEKDLFDYINRVTSSSFAHTSNGLKYLNDKIDICNFDTEKDIIEFVEFIDDRIHFNVYVKSENTLRSLPQG